MKSKITPSIALMKRLFKRADTATDRFRRKSMMACVSGCGRCCENPQVETNIAQVLPMARYLFKMGLMEEIWQKLQNPLTAVSCILYQPDPLIPGKGRCSQYALRPLICRLFGFSARRNKQGQASLIHCLHIKNDQPENTFSTQQLINGGLKVPMFHEFSSRAESIMPENNQLMPINKAIQKALEIVSLDSRYRSRKAAKIK